MRLALNQDVGIAAEAVERGIWTPEPVQASELPLRFGHLLSPAERHAAASHA